jgi:hypothetical protein
MHQGRDPRSRQGQETLNPLSVAAMARSGGHFRRSPLS